MADVEVAESDIASPTFTFPPLASPLVVFPPLAPITSPLPLLVLVAVTLPPLASPLVVFPPVRTSQPGIPLLWMLTILLPASFPLPGSIPDPLVEFLPLPCLLFFSTSPLVVFPPSRTILNLIAPPLSARIVSSSLMSSCKSLWARLLNPSGVAL